MPRTNDVTASMAVDESTPTIESRLNVVNRNLLVIGAVLRHLGTDEDHEWEREELCAALMELAVDSAETLYWVKRMPRFLVTLPAPDDDQLPPHELTAAAATLDRVVRVNLAAAMGGAR